MYREIPLKLLGLIEPIVGDHGLELVDAEIAGARGARILRVIVDTPENDGGVSVETCAALSRELGAQLDAEDVVAGRYRLEVSSPGLDRVLAREKDFDAACGREIKLETRQPIDGRRRFRGRLLGFEQGVLRLEVDGREVAIGFDDVSRANAVYEFTPADFGRGRHAAGPGGRD